MRYHDCFYHGRQHHRSAGLNFLTAIFGNTPSDGFERHVTERAGLMKTKQPRDLRCRKIVLEVAHCQVAP